MMQTKLRCSEISESDIEAIVTLLSRGGTLTLQAIAGKGPRGGRYWWKRLL